MWSSQGGYGVRNCEHFVDVLNGWSLKQIQIQTTFYCLLISVVKAGDPLFPRPYLAELRVREAAESDRGQTPVVEHPHGNVGVGDLVEVVDGRLASGLGRHGNQIADIGHCHHNTAYENVCCRVGS